MREGRLSGITPFFAAGSDLMPILAAVEGDLPCQYVLAGMFDDPKPTIFMAGRFLPGLGYAEADEEPGCRHYFITPAMLPIAVRSVPQRRGGVRYAIDLRENPQGIELTPGGVFEPRCVISGRIACGSADPVARKLYSRLRSSIRRSFQKIQAFYIGSEAARLLDDGWRLTHGIGFNPVCDLRR